MTDQQFQDFVNQLTGAISSLGVRQDQTTQQLSQQLGQISQQLGQTTGPQAASQNASVFVDTLNRNFNFNKMKGPERPDQISQNQVYIAGFSPAAASMLNKGGGGGGVSGLSKNDLESVISQLPIVGPVWDTMKSIVSFFMSPANLVTLGGMGMAFLALKKFFNDSPAGEFFKQTMSDMYKLITDTLGKIVNFFTEDEFTGEDLRSRISTVKDDFVAGVKNFFTEGGWFHSNIMQPMMTAFKESTNQILIASGLFTGDGDGGVDFVYKDKFAEIGDALKATPGIITKTDQLLASMIESFGNFSGNLNKIPFDKIPDIITGVDKMFSTGGSLDNAIANFNSTLRYTVDIQTALALALKNSGIKKTTISVLGKEVPWIKANDFNYKPPQPPTLVDDAVKFDNNDNFIAAKEGGILTQRLDKIASSMEKLIEVTSNNSNGAGTIINQTQNTLGGRATPKFGNYESAPGMDTSFA